MMPCMYFFNYDASLGLVVPLSSYKCFYQQLLPKKITLKLKNRLKKFRKIKNNNVIDCKSINIEI